MININSRLTSELLAIVSKVLRYQKEDVVGHLLRFSVSDQDVRLTTAIATTLLGHRLASLD